MSERELLIRRRLKRQPVQRRDAESLDRGPVLRRRIAHVRGELPARVLHVSPLHVAVARDLGDDGCRRDRSAARIAADDGALLAPDHKTVLGSLLILEGDNEAEIEALLAQDPYAKAGLFASVDVKPWRQAVGASLG